MLSHKQNLLEMLTICSEVVIKYLEEREGVPGVGRLLRQHLQEGGGGVGGGQEARCGNRRVVTAVVILRLRWSTWSMSTPKRDQNISLCSTSRSLNHAKAWTGVCSRAAQ